MPRFKTKNTHCWWFRNPANQLIWYSKYLIIYRGFIFLPSTVATEKSWSTHRNFTDPSTPLKWHRPHQKGQGPGAKGGLEQKWMEGHRNSFILKSREHFVWKRSRRFKKVGKETHRIHGIFTYIHECLIFLGNVVFKYTKQMDPSWVCCFHIFLGWFIWWSCYWIILL